MLDSRDIDAGMPSMPGHWPSRWPAEDGGPARRQVPLGGRGLGLTNGESLVATSRDAIAATMVVLRDPGQAYLLRHTGGDQAVSWVERFDPITLEVLERSPDLPGGPTWPGGMAAHADGSLHVVFGRHAHKLGPDTTLLASRELPRNRPYNSFVILPDGHLATKDFAGVLGAGSSPNPPGPSELLVLEPETLAIVARLELPEPSIARLSALGDDVYVVGESSLLRVRWDGTRLELDAGFSAPYRSIEGQTYGWDAVLADGSAWFLDNGAASEQYAGTFRGVTGSSAPLHLVRVDLESGAVELTEICGVPGGVVANPPVVDIGRGMVVGYDSGNGVVVGFRIDGGGTRPVWERQWNHASHPLLFPDTGELLLADHDPAIGDQALIVDIETGHEKARVATGSPLQSVLFPCPGFDRDLYVCSFTTLSRIAVA